MAHCEDGQMEPTKSHSRAARVRSYEPVFLHDVTRVFSLRDDGQIRVRSTGLGERLPPHCRIGAKHFVKALIFGIQVPYAEPWR